MLYNGITLTVYPEKSIFGFCRKVTHIDGENNNFEVESSKSLMHTCVGTMLGLVISTYPKSKTITIMRRVFLNFVKKSPTWMVRITILRLRVASPSCILVWGQLLGAPTFLLGHPTIF